MSEAEKELRRLLEAATPGPWKFETCNGMTPSCAMYGYVPVLHSWHEAKHQDNVAFAVAARNTLPALLAELDELRNLYEMNAEASHWG